MHRVSCTQGRERAAFSSESVGFVSNGYLTISKKTNKKKSLKKKKKRIQLRLCFLEGKKKVSAGELLRVFQPR